MFLTIINALIIVIILIVGIMIITGITLTSLIAIAIIFAVKAVINSARNIIYVVANIYPSGFFAINNIPTINEIGSNNPRSKPWTINVV